MGKVQSAGTEHNVYWNLGHLLGNEFEDIIYEILLKEYKVRLYNEITIEQTPRKNDGGKDIIIEFSCQTLNLFDINFSRGECDKATIYIECKSTNSRNALRREKFMPSIEKGSRTGIDYYVLLTNSKILSADYYEAEQLLNSRKIKFILIDQYLLARFLINKNYDYFGEIPLYNGEDDYYVQYQVYANGADENKYDIYFTFRNYSKHSRLYAINLLTDVNWKTEENSFSFTLDANCATAKKISLSCDNENDFHTLVFKIEVGVHESFAEIKGINITEVYTPPFIGKYHNKILFGMLKNINLPDCDKLFCLWGEAGIGKTRIVNELPERIKSGYFDFFVCSLTRNNVQAIRDIQDFLVRRKYISSDDKNRYGDNLYDTILNCHHTAKTAVIFIDDFHNILPEYIEQIKKLANHYAPVILILCGRTDYTEGDTAYYSFVQWTFENLKLHQNVWNVKPLHPKETKRLIRVMIQRIPDEALNTIYLHSNNNPLYVVQFIEYLLDNKIAYIVNKNTVGIVDPAEFQTHNYLPNGIEDIYSKRITYLSKVSEQGDSNYLMFLFILSLFNGQITVSTTERWFDREGMITEFLLKRGFIIKRKNYYTFYHESLKLYILKMLSESETYKKDVSAYFLHSSEQAWNDLPLYTKGRLYLWAGMTEKAFEIFSPIINSVKRIKNISNIDIDPLTYEYFDDVLQLFKSKQEYSQLAKNAINGKIYVTLHHFVPMNAAIECDRSIEYIKSSPDLKKDKRFIHSLLVQKAHALLNSGMNLEGELVLKELQAKWLVSNEDFDSKSVFDMLDRLCAIYIKFNCFDIAFDYEKLELDAAYKSGDYSLSAIAYRTRSKLFYLNDMKECLCSLDKVDEMLRLVPSDRIQLNNDIYRAIVDLTYNEENCYNEIIDRVEKLAATAFEQNLNRADIQSNMVLAAAYLKRGSFQDLKTARQKTVRAINYSIRFGIPSYMWQLYNLLAVIDTKLKVNSNKIKQSFEMSFDILNRQNLLYIGRGDLCYSNLLAISNIGIFLRRNSYQKTFNSRMSMLTYCDNNTKKGTSRKLSGTELTRIYEKAMDKKMLFSSADSAKFLRDDETGYFLALT